VRRILALLLLSPGLLAQDVIEEDSRVDTTDEVIPIVRVRPDRGPIDHLGWGTPEDLFVELGAGAAVSVFSGNFVLSVPTFVRADLPADGRFALTYNHMDSGGSPELAPGWSWDLGRALVPGPWGDRVLVDADGFRDSFFAGPPPSEEEAADLAEQVVRGWKRGTPARQRRAGGGEAALREMLAADPLFFGEMRDRFVGPAPEPSGDEAWRSDQRGRRSLVRSKDRRELILTRHDGGAEVYSDAGFLKSVEPTLGNTIELSRENGRVVGVDVDGRRAVHVSRDSYDRIQRLRGTDGKDVVLHYIGPVLHRLETPRGELRFTYDRAGRLVSTQGPDGGVDLTYDDASGRLLRGSGPAGRITLGDIDGNLDAISVRVETEDGARTASWDGPRRERVLDGGGSTERVRFDAAGLPVDVDVDGRSWSFEWTALGRLLRAEHEGQTVVFERGESGELKAVVDAGGARATVRTDGNRRVAGWSEPEGHRTDVNLDDSGRPERMEYPGGRIEQIWRDRSGLLRSVDASGSGGPTLVRDGRGRIRTAETALGASASVQIDEGGRLTRFEPPSGGRAEIAYDAAGRVVRLVEPGGDLVVRYDGGRTAGWRGGFEDVRLERGVDGSVSAVRTRRGDWGVSRSKGRVDRLDFRGSVSLDWDRAGRLAGWSRGPDGLTLRRDRTGFVTAWSTPSRGEVVRRVDGWGRVTELARTSARWTFTRDRSGRIRTLGAPAGGAWRLGRDSVGRLSLIAGPRDLRWRVERDPSGRAKALRVGESSWTLRRDRAGRVTDLTPPNSIAAELVLDRAGRWTELKRPGLRPLTANYSARGPTAVGAARRVYASSGALEGWAPVEPVGEWFVDRGADGLIATIGWRRGRSVAATGSEVRRRIDRSDDTVRAGPWTLSGRHGRLDSLEMDVPDGAPLVWSVRRDSSGRAQGFDAPGGQHAEVSHAPDGEARTLRIDDVEWALGRDVFGRVTSVGRGDDRWTLTRDPLGRAARWAVDAAGGDPFEVTFDPMDGTQAGDTTLAEALGVQTDGETTTDLPAGSMHVQVDVPGIGRLVAFDELCTALGRLAGVEGFWGTTGSELSGDLDVSIDPTLASDSGLQPAHDAIGDVLGALLAPNAVDLLLPLWGGEPLRSGTGSSLLPSPTGRGVGAAVTAGVGYVRLPALSGGTITWLGPGASIDGLRLPSPSGPWVTPTGWLGRPTPGGAEDPPVRAEQDHAPFAGPPAVVEGWWGGFALNPQDLAILPPGLGVGARAWERPRIDRQASAANLPALEPPTDVGAALPPVPGLDRLLPGRRGGRTLALLEALVRSGDLPVGSDEGRDWLDPAAEWTLWLPGSAMLEAVARRRASPSSPPWRPFGGLAGGNPVLDGVLTSAGRAWEASASDDGPHLAIRGLPGGTAPLRPGRFGPTPGGRETIASQAHGPAIHALSDDPLVPGAAGREAARSDGVLLAAHALSRHGRVPTSPWLTAGSSEAWVLQTPGGVRAVIDGGGRLLSLASRSRESEAWRRAATAHAGLQALHPSEPRADVRFLEGPQWLPGPSDRPETAWGLAPVDPDRPLTALGAPAVPALIGVHDPDLGPLDVWRGLPSATAPPAASGRDL
jgi:YD repeat-containing protein